MMATARQAAVRQDTTTTTMAMGDDDKDGDDDRDEELDRQLRAIEFLVDQAGLEEGQQQQSRDKLRQGAMQHRRIDALVR